MWAVLSAPARAQSETQPPPGVPTEGVPAEGVPAEEASTDDESFFVPGEEGPPIMTAWYNPLGFFGESPLEASFELGINGSQGNGDAISFRTGVDLERHTDIYDWETDFVYNKNRANQLETQHNALLDSNLDWKLKSPRWSVLSKFALEYDEFKNFNLRLVMNAGFGYKFIDTDLTDLKGRYGSGVSREFGGTDKNWVPEALFGLDVSHQLTHRQELEMTVDYFPAYENFSDHRIVTDASWKVMLDEATNMSLKLGVIDRYDSTPNGAQHNDLDYAILLLWSL